ncbi:hypothetical protein V6N13_139236 [Hibiscus sabdariffa]|uniref:RIN4 pathogenic type III effector avirulence factor Avr cleavage site domain-containing protein n=1 Tax=Hibiscus sabdariffa TaxID=183260 RepID=A0ABR2C8Q5_9ROSI
MKRVSVWSRDPAVKTATPINQSLVRNLAKGKLHRRAPSIPKFGDWDENDPASCENLKAIFESVKEEKKSPSFPTSPPQSSQTKRGVPCK